jgi:hypothetical protein
VEPRPPARQPASRASPAPEINPSRTPQASTSQTLIRSRLVVETVLLQRLYVLVFIEHGATEETADIRLATSDGQFDEDV